MPAVLLTCVQSTILSISGVISEYFLLWPLNYTSKPKPRNQAEHLDIEYERIEGQKGMKELETTHWKPDSVKAKVKSREIHK